MAFSVSTRSLGDVVVLDMSGHLDAGEPVLLLRNTLRRFLDGGRRKFVLNLADVPYIDSSGLGELVRIYASVRNREGQVNLLSLTKSAKNQLQVTKLVTVFDTFDEEVDAVRALGEGTGGIG